MQHLPNQSEPVEPEIAIEGTNLSLPQVCEMIVRAEQNELSQTDIETAHEDAQEWLDIIEMRPRQYFDPVTISITVAGIVPVYIWYSTPWYFMGSSWICGLFCIPLAGAVIHSRISRMRREAREDQLADLSDVRWIGPLIQALDTSKGRRRAGAHRVLPQLLARLRPTDAGLLDAALQASLIYNLRLNRHRDMDLNAAIIKALVNVGDEAALSAIEHTADTYGWLPSLRYIERIARMSVGKMGARLAKGPGVIPAQAVSEPNASPSRRGKQHEFSPEVDTLKKRLKEEQDGRTSPGMRRPFLIAAWTVILPVSLWLTILSLWDKDYLIATAWGTLLALTTQLPRYVLSREQSAAAQRLAAFDNVQGVGPLAEALEWPDPAIKTIAARSLVRLLPLLNASDSGLLTSRQRGCLHRVLRMGNARRQESLIIAILKALEQVGDESAVPFVKQLANSNPKTRIQERVQLRAQMCLPFLEAGASQRQGSQTLLRASSADATQPDVLLRSASGASVTEPVQLLRAGAEGE